MTLLQGSASSPAPTAWRPVQLLSRALVLLPVAMLLAAAGASTPLHAQTAPEIVQAVDPASVTTLANHHPLWARPANDAGALPANRVIDSLTMVLARSTQQEADFEEFLTEQQDPKSPNYHHWLTPAEVGQRYGLSDQDIATLTGWLTSQGLHVNWIAPNRIFIGFGGATADINRAFQTELHTYKVNGAERYSVSSDPAIPAALAPAIQSIRGLFSVPEQPQHSVRTELSSTPEDTTSGGSHFLAPADFNTIYNVPGAYTGAGKTIGIVSWSRVNTADLTAFTSRTGVNIPTPTVVIPTGYGGIDPGAAYTTTPPSGTSIGGQSEATLDVLRAGSTAPGASILLVASSQSGSNDGIGADAQYIVGTTPVPAQIMSISFGSCENSGGPSDVTFWNGIFQTGASEGISIFVSSGDSGASGCENSFATPQSNSVLSPNSICSSSYATCVGGTEFNDTASPSTYWNSSNGTGLSSAISYIPEGGWNESTLTNVAASGGGVSSFISSPSWQTGTGVPTPHTGRYTPDVSFSAAGHDGYFGCMAAGGGSCVTSGGSYAFEVFSGTSAAAPAMAGIAALLDQKLGAAQGNLNPGLYAEAAVAPSAFHDITLVTSGVSGCTSTTPSMCDNTIPSSTSLTGGIPGYLVTSGFDEVTGLGSLNVATFISNFGAAALITPTVTVAPSASSITAAQSLTVTVTMNGGSGNPTPTGTVILTSGTYTSSTATLSAGAATISIAAGALATGTDTLTVSYTPDSGSSSTYTSATGTNSVIVTLAKITPNVTVTASATSITTTQALTVTVTMNGGAGNPTPTGTVILTSGTYTSSTATLSAGSASINIAAGALATGNDTLTVAYTPDSSSSSTYNAANGTGSVAVTTAPKTTPIVTVTPSASSITTAQSLTVTVTLSGGSGNPTPTGSVVLVAGTGSFNGTLVSGVATITVPAGTFASGSDQLTATYTPDSTSSSIYNAATGAASVTVTTPPVFSISGTAPSPGSITISSPGGSGSSTITVAPNGFSGTITFACLVSGPSGASYPPACSLTPASLTVSGSTAQTTVLSVTTTAVSAMARPVRLFWPSAGGTALALLLFFVPRRRRNWLGMLCLLILVASLGALGCGGGSSGGGGGGITGTSTGSYTVTVTGTSGSTTGTVTVPLTVQ